MSEVRISDKISYIEGYDEPLSADVGIVRDGDVTFVYDVGNGDRMLEAIPENINVVISHFHADHLGNIDKVKYTNLYVSNETYKHTRQGTIVNGGIKVGNVHIFELPSCHAKGCLGLEVDEKYAFVGDGTYSKRNSEGYVYNSQLLKAQIDVLKSLKAETLLLSHHKGLCKSKAEVLGELEKIYSMRTKDSHEILVPYD